MNSKIAKNLYPFTGKLFQLGNWHYHYLDEGSGEPLVMVHGNPTWSLYYRELVKSFRDHYRCLVPDHIGCGFSDKPAASQYDYTLRQRIDDLENFLEALQLTDPITLVMHDWGGYIGMGYACRHPDKIKRLIVFNTGAFLLPASKKLPWILKFFRNSRLAVVLSRGLNLFSIGTTLFGCRKKWMPTPLRHLYCLPYDSWSNRVAVARFVQDIPLTPEDRSYQTILEIQNKLPQFQGKPMLICWGEKDFVFDRHFCDTWLKYFPKAEVCKFPQGGHLVLEDAAEEIIALMRDFLQRT